VLPSAVGDRLALEENALDPRVGGHDCDEQCAVAAPDVDHHPARGEIVGGENRGNAFGGSSGLSFVVEPSDLGIRSHVREGVHAKHMLERRLARLHAVKEATPRAIGSFPGEKREAP
jgi:hypothetical protein